MSEKMKGRKPKWSKDSLLLEGKKFSSMKEWRQKEPSSYNAAFYQGVLKECSTHMIRPQRPYSKEEVEIIAKNYETRTKFMKSEPGAYQYAWREKFLDEVCGHMEIPYGGMSKGNIFYIYAIEFSDKSVYIGLSSAEARFKEHLENKKGIVFKTAQSLNETPKNVIIKSNLTGSQAGIEEKKGILLYKENGWRILNLREAGSMGSGKAYTDQELHSIAQKYSSRGDFCCKNPSAYRSATRRGILDSCCQHMTSLQVNWTLDLAIEESKKYSSRSDWQRNCNRSYVIVRDSGLLDEVMPSKMKDWDEKSVLLEKGKYRTHGQWAKESPGSYNFWKKNIRVKPLVVRNLFSE